MQGWSLKDKAFKPVFLLFPPDRSKNSKNSPKGRCNFVMTSYAMRRLRIWAAMNIPRRYPRAKPRAGIVVIAAAVVILFIIAVNIFFARVEPVIKALAIATAREYVVTVINRVVEEEITSGSLIYGEFVTLEKNDSGSVTALITDMARVNVLQSRISTLVATSIVNVLHRDLNIPLGDAFGAAFFSWRGPKLPIRMESVSNVTTLFVNEFESSGINQTRHRLALAITTDIVILVPGGRTTAEVTSTVPIAETVIVGSVPNIYTN